MHATNGFARNAVYTRLSLSRSAQSCTARSRVLDWELMMMHDLLDSRSHSLVVCAAQMSLAAFGCSVLDDDYYPELVEAPAEVPNADGAGLSGAGSTAEPALAAAPEGQTPDVQAPGMLASGAEGEGTSPQRIDDSEAAAPSQGEAAPDGLTPLPEPADSATSTTPEL